jgi:hypothetical protein
VSVQAEHARSVVKKVLVDGGVELILCNPGGNMATDTMAAEFDALLRPAGSFVDEVPLKLANQAVFKEAVLGALESAVATAVAPATEAVGLDCFGGTDFGVAAAVAAARFRGRMAELTERIQARKVANAMTGDEPVANAAAADQGRGPMSASAAGAAAPAMAVPMQTPLGLLEARLAAPEYDLVRATAASVKEGLYAGACPPEWGARSLTTEALDALARAGATPGALAAAGYPSALAEQLREHLVKRASQVRR